MIPRIHTLLLVFTLVGCANPLPDASGDDATTIADPSPNSTSGVASSGSSGSIDSSDPTTSAATTGVATTTGNDPPWPPQATVLELDFSRIKHFDFSWAPSIGAVEYELLESSAPGRPFFQLGEEIMSESVSMVMPLHRRSGASYLLRARNDAGEALSLPVSVSGSLAEAVGYVKASNADPDDRFGSELALSGDGMTLAVSAAYEDGGSVGIDGNEDDNSAMDAGAMYIFVRDTTGQWVQQAYIKPTNIQQGDHFGTDVALNGDGNTLVVGASREDSSSTGVNGSQDDDSAPDSGAVYVYSRSAMGQWSQAAYIKASNSESPDWFGTSVALSSDGNTLAVGSQLEDGGADGINGDPGDNTVPDTGAVYVFVRQAPNEWIQQAYVKASNTDTPSDYFGHDLSLSADGNTLAVGAYLEDSESLGVGGNQIDESALNAGAVYVFVRDMKNYWSQQAYIKASNTDPEDYFGVNVALSGDGNTLAVGAEREDGGAVGVGGNHEDDTIEDSGAVYVFARDAGGLWSQQAYVKASNTDAFDLFGRGVALNNSGDVLAVGARQEDGNSVGIDGGQAPDTVEDSGAVYVFERFKGQWSQRSYVKAPNTGFGDLFGLNLVLDAVGDTLVIAARHEDGGDAGIDGLQTDDSAPLAGAVYLY